mmetsp:Transcript_84341/g.272663  ORF Transcript_84341/g.272663 Transcript_84341/m.272663 type:complete len:370 (-) Transcript_84341:720-1829(-)
MPRPTQLGILLGLGDTVLDSGRLLRLLHDAREPALLHLLKVLRGEQLLATGNFGTIGIVFKDPCQLIHFLLFGDAWITRGHGIRRRLRQRSRCDVYQIWGCCRRNRRVCSRWGRGLSVVSRRRARWRGLRILRCRHRPVHFRGCGGRGSVGRRTTCGRVRGRGSGSAGCGCQRLCRRQNLLGRCRPLSCRRCNQSLSRCCRLLHRRCRRCRCRRRRCSCRKCRCCCLRCSCRCCRLRCCCRWCRCCCLRCSRCMCRCCRRHCGCRMRGDGRLLRTCRRCRCFGRACRGVVGRRELEHADGGQRARARARGGRPRRRGGGALAGERRRRRLGSGLRHRRRRGPRCCPHHHRCTQRCPCVCQNRRRCRLLR